jgi:fatty-acyl-CoA synthase
MSTVVDSIVDRGGGTGSLTVLRPDGGVATTVPWRAVHERARRMSAVLAGIGLGRGSRVGILGDTGVDLIAALQAAWLRAAAITVLPPPIGKGQRGYLDGLLAVIADADLHAVVMDEAVMDEAVVEDRSMVHRAIAARCPATIVVSLRTLAMEADVVPPAVPVRPDPMDLAVLQYTSGSTRNPRGVPVTHGNLAANLAAIKVATDHDADHPSRMLSWLPLHHDMGLIGFLTLPMSCGCPLVLHSPVTFARRPASWLEALSRHRITTSGAPNFAYGLMTRLLVAGLEVDLSPVRFLLSGGEPVDPAMMARFVAAARAYGLDPAAIVPAYGLAESTLAVSFSPRGAGVRVDRVDPQALETQGHATPAGPGSRARQLVRVGPPAPGMSVRIGDTHTDEPVADRRVGRIEIRGPSVVGHYWGDVPPPAGSWLRTGDLGYLVDGELVVCGREKDVLFAAGRNVFPQDIEAVAAEVSGVRAGGAVAFGIPGDQGDRLVVAVESRGVDPEVVRRAVAVAVASEVGLTPADVVILRIGRLPKTTSGKLRRSETRRQYLAGELILSGQLVPSREEALEWTLS